jgi:hypothetical protein
VLDVVLDRVHECGFSFAAKRDGAVRERERRRWKQEMLRNAWPWGDSQKAAPRRAMWRGGRTDHVEVRPE